MKTIGLLGGTGWESTVLYYNTINQEVGKILGKEHSAKIILFSIDFYEISSRIAKNDFDGIGKFIQETSEKMEHAGADCLVVCANTLHMFAEQIVQTVNIPLIHIADATGQKIIENKITKVGLLGTKPTMEFPFYKNRLKEKFGIDTIVPEAATIDKIQKIIVNELLQGIFKPETKAFFLEVMNQLVKEGAEGIILGCTDIPLIIGQKDTSILLFDTAEIHAKAAVEFSLKKQ